MSNYWDMRYKGCAVDDEVIAGSGLGSVGDAVDKRIALINEHVDDINSVLDVGCGDFNVGKEIKKLFPHAKYKGLDTSSYLIRKLKKQHGLDFEYLTSSHFNYPSDLVVCFDVLYHIMDDKEYELMLASLKRSWKKYLIIITDNKNGTDKDEGSDYMKKRVFDPTYFGKDYITSTNIENTLEGGSSIIMYIWKK